MQARLVEAVEPVAEEAARWEDADQSWERAVEVRDQLATRMERSWDQPSRRSAGTRRSRRCGWRASGGCPARRAERSSPSSSRIITVRMVS